jgi:hypothetical protein
MQIPLNLKKNPFKKRFKWILKWKINGEENYRVVLYVTYSADMKINCHIIRSGKL